MSNYGVVVALPMCGPRSEKGKPAARLGRKATGLGMVPRSPGCRRTRGSVPVAGPPGRVSRRAGIMRSSPLAGVRVLLVDDDELVREALHDYFVECGAVVVAAASARAALKAFMQAPPAVLVSDLRMPPGEDGFWLIAAVRALKPSQGGEVPAVAGAGAAMGAPPGLAGRLPARAREPATRPRLGGPVGRPA